jgi:hypothetical protein
MMALADPRSRAAWRTFRMRAEFMLGSVSREARREILFDLDVHVEEAMRRAQDGDEYLRLMAALDRLGDPRDFLAPLIADAVFKRPRAPGGAALAWRAVLLGAQRGARDLAFATGLLLLGLIGAATACMGVARLIAPERAGIFAIGPDSIQIRLLTGAGAEGVQVLPAWGALFAVAAGVGLVVFVARALKRLVTSYLIGTRETR